MTPPSKMNILLIVLLISLGINIYELLLLKRCCLSCHGNEGTCENNTVSPNGLLDTDLLKPKHCEDIGRYSPKDTARGGEEIDSASATVMIENYRFAHSTDTTIYRTTGFSFSKKVFDKIFDHKNSKLNMIRFDLITKNDSLFLIAKGISTNYSEITTTIPFINGGMFLSRSFCPFDCKLD